MFQHVVLLLYYYYCIVVAVVHTLGFKRIKPYMFSSSADILIDERNNLSHLAKVIHNQINRYKISRLLSLLHRQLFSYSGIWLHQQPDQSLAGTHSLASLHADPEETIFRD